jgi:hypothetical protein
MPTSPQPTQVAAWTADNPLAAFAGAAVMQTLPPPPPPGGGFMSPFPILLHNKREATGQIRDSLVAEDAADPTRYMCPAPAFQAMALLVAPIVALVRHRVFRNQMPEADFPNFCSDVQQGKYCQYCPTSSVERGAADRCEDNCEILLAVINPPGPGNPQFALRGFYLLTGNSPRTSFPEAYWFMRYAVLASAQQGIAPWSSTYWLSYKRITKRNIYNIVRFCRQGDDPKSHLWVNDKAQYDEHGQMQPIAYMRTPTAATVVDEINRRMLTPQALESQAALLLQLTQKEASTRIQDLRKPVRQVPQVGGFGAPAQPTVGVGMPPMPPMPTMPAAYPTPPVGVPPMPAQPQMAPNPYASMPVQQTTPHQQMVERPAEVAPWTPDGAQEVATTSTVVTPPPAVNPAAQPVSEDAIATFMQNVPIG